MQEYGLSDKAIRRFNIMGAQAWMRAFTTPGGLFVWLPQAIMWTKARGGNIAATRRFLRTTIFWAQIGGWIFFIFSLAVSAYVIYPDIFPSDPNLESVC